MQDQKIPIEILETQALKDSASYSRTILENEIDDVHVEHIAIVAKNTIAESAQEGVRTVYLFVKGEGKILAEDNNYELVPETIFLPNNVRDFKISAANNSEVHCLKISRSLSDQDHIEIQKLPENNVKAVYHAKFSDCQSYTEEIKSLNTVSRTILSNEYIPRVAMGTVLTKGPDKVAPHKHPMLEQLFLGLSRNNCVVYADDSTVSFPEFSIVHIPLGSTHSVSVEQGEVLYYVWMDFFLDKKGEEWLQTHNVDSTSAP